MTVFGDHPRQSFTGFSDGEQTRILVLSNAPIIFHDASFLVFHDDSNVVFHQPIYPDIQSQQNIRVPRSEFAGSADL